MNAASHSTLITKRYENIRKSQADKREYRGLELSNGMKLLLISDPTTEKGAASLDVNIGHLMDPTELPGLAHFCEHMLFMGTEKYPDENAYSSFISGAGGSSNAYTTAESTNYHFDVAFDQLPEALDRFTQFFISPLFTESAVEREVNAVHSEHTNNVKNDCWRSYQLEKALARPSHDFAKFGTGNRETLMEIPKSKGVIVRDELLKFHETYYSSNIMTCTILGKESLDELEALAMSMNFGDIANKNVKPKSWEDDRAYGPNELGHRIDVVSVRDVRQLRITFAIDDQTSFYKSQPADYVSHLIGHEGKGSLFSELKHRGWATSLWACSHKKARGIGSYTIGMELSEEGLERVDKIVELTFQAIGTIRSAGPQKWFQDELERLGEIDFRFKDTQSPFAYVQRLSGALQTYPLDDVLSHAYLVEEYNPELIGKLLDQLIPENMNYFVLSKRAAELENLSKEQYYGINYRKTALGDDLMETFKKALVTAHEALFLPERNEYIPSQFELRPREENKVTTPRVVRDDQLTRVWYLQDDEFKLPKAKIHISITLPKLAADPVKLVVSNLYVKCFQDFMTEEVYNSNIAGLDDSLQTTLKGLELKFSGYDEKLCLFAVNYVRQLVNFQADQKRFDIALDKLVRELKNFDHAQPYSQGQYFSSVLLDSKRWTYAQQLAVTEIVTLEMVNEFIGQIWKALHVEIFVHGNLSEGDASSLTDEILAVFHEKNASVRPLFSNEFEVIREMKLNEGDSQIYEVKQNTHANSSVHFILQTGLAEPRAASLLALFVQLAKEPAFSILRTKEQLGYVVWSYARRFHGTQSLQMVVQGSYAPKHAEERIEAFLNSFRETIAEMSEEEYQKNVQALETQLLEKPKTLDALSNLHWRQIESKQYFFNRAEIIVAELHKIAKEDLLQFYDEKIAAGSPQRQKLSVRVVSTIENDDKNTTVTPSDGIEGGGVFIEDIDRFKASLSTYGRPKPAIELRSVGVSQSASTFKESVQ